MVVAISVNLDTILYLVHCNLWPRLSGQIGTAILISLSILLRSLSDFDVYFTSTGINKLNTSASLNNKGAFGCKSIEKSIYGELFVLYRGIFIGGVIG